MAETQEQTPPKDLQNPAAILDELAGLEDWLDKQEALWPDAEAEVDTMKREVRALEAALKIKEADLMLAAPKDFTLPMKNAWVTTKLAESQEHVEVEAKRVEFNRAAAVLIKLETMRKIKSDRMDILRSALSWHKEQLRQEGFGGGQRNV